MQHVNQLKLFFCCLMLLCLCTKANAQRKFKRPNAKKSRVTNNDPFLRTQWWLGVKGGINLTQAVPGERFTAFSSTTQVTNERYQKEYDDFSKVGGQAGLEITFFHRGFSFSLQPNFRKQRFVYSNDFEWFDPENAQNTLTLQYVQDHKLDFIEIPLIVKYDILQSNIRPYVFVGGYYAALINANKALSITGTDRASGSPNEFQGDEIIIGADDLFIRSSLGILGGIGASADFGNIRFNLDVGYRLGLTNITDVRNRFTENRLAGVGDALDDLKLRNISINFGVLFPLRFLVSGNFRAVD